MDKINPRLLLKVFIYLKNKKGCAIHMIHNEEQLIEALTKYKIITYETCYKIPYLLSDREIHVCKIQHGNYMSIIIDCYWNNQYIHSSEELYVDLCSLTIEPNTENKALTVAIKILAYNLYGI